MEKLHTPTVSLRFVVVCKDDKGVLFQYGVYSTFEKASAVREYLKTGHHTGPNLVAVSILTKQIIRQFIAYDEQSTKSKGGRKK